MTENEAVRSFLELMAERAAADRAYLAWAVHAYVQVEGESRADVLERIGAPQTGAAEFLLSLRPTGVRFGDMVRSICARFGSHELALVELLRRVEVLEALRDARVTETENSGLLMAARMRAEDARLRRIVKRDDNSLNEDDKAEKDHGERWRPSEDDDGDAR